MVEVENCQNKHVVESSASLVPFVAHPWIRNNHFQTIVANFLPFTKTLDFTKTFFVPLLDGDRLALNFVEANKEYDKNTIWIIGHGLTGDSSANYIHRIANELHRLGYSLLIIDHRNCGKGKGLAKNPYHSGRSDDLQAIIDWARREYPQCKIGVLGFSMSGNILLKNLIESSLAKGLPQPDFAISVNPPINLNATAKAFTQGFNKIYDKYFVNRLLKSMEQNPQVQQQKRWKRLIDLDNEYTAPKSGYRDADHMYTHSSTFANLHLINIPTWILTSSDDPLVPANYFHCENSKHVSIHVTEGGGHMGYIHKDKTPLGHSFWMDYAIIKKIKEFDQLKKTETKK
ncbi:MAG: YheT family hydrolase [Bdellovibrio sp.]